MSLPPQGPEQLPPSVPSSGTPEASLRPPVVDATPAAHLLLEGMIRQEALVPVGPPEFRTFELNSEAMVLAARQIQARAYWRRRYVTPEGLNQADETLSETIDPIDLASTYFGTVEPDGAVTGCIKLKEPKDGDPFSLPTLAKLADLHGRDNPLLSVLPFIAGGASVFEGSALGRVPGSDRAVMTKLLLAMRSKAAERGFDYCVVGVVDEVAHWLTATYGEQAFHRIGSPSTIIRLEGPGLRPAGVVLEPYYVDIKDFRRACLEHFRQQPDNPRSQLNIPLFEASLNFAAE